MQTPLLRYWVMDGRQNALCTGPLRQTIAKPATPTHWTRGQCNDPVRDYGFKQQPALAPIAESEPTGSGERHVTQIRTCRPCSEYAGRGKPVADPRLCLAWWLARRLGLGWWLGLARWMGPRMANWLGTCLGSWMGTRLGAWMGMGADRVSSRRQDFTETGVLSGVLSVDRGGRVGFSSIGAGGNYQT